MKRVTTIALLLVILCSSLGATDYYVCETDQGTAETPTVQIDMIKVDKDAYPASTAP